MTEVLHATAPVPVQVDRTAYFAASSRLRRSPSSNMAFYVAASDAYAHARSVPKGSPHLHADYAGHAPALHSAPSSAPSSPGHSHHDLSRLPSDVSTPDSCLSLNPHCPPDGDDNDQIIFPSYDGAGYFDQPPEADPPTSPSTDAPDPAIPPGESASQGHDPPRPRSPDVLPTAEDDSAVRSQPSRHVDYLSHDWREEDIWASWRHIVSKRKVYGNSVRLENACWRTWMKSKYRLRTVSPETLNWLKDCDVTWLYGPLQTHTTRALPGDTPAGSRLSKTNSFLHKKPILKKRSMSEIMLQKSISASSLLKQAAAAIHAQQRGCLSGGIGRRPSLSRATSDFAASSFASQSGSGEPTSAYPSASSSGLQTPATGERRHIHFNNKVEQCIAVDVVKEGEDDEDDPYNAVDSDSDSDDGVVMMKVSSKASSKVKIGQRTPRRNSSSVESKTIAMLPSTTLKSQDTPESEDSSSGGSGRHWSARKLSPSPSQETLRPSKPSTNFLLNEDDDDVDMAWEPSGAFGGNRTEGASRGRDRPTDASNQRDEAEEHRGLRRTASGMFMPYDEDEDDVPTGLLGKVVDTVNTAKDIAHVIWNVGWRR